ncbi:MAG: peptidase C39 family protein [Nanoarchaeota archaeon]|nr:peptidase C39 family protein [Nanoarchaeota archaeon]
MLLKIPFYENNGDGNQCMQVAMKSVLKYFLDKDFSLSELDNLTGRKEDFWTYTSQIVSVLYDLGLDLKFYSKEDLKPFLRGESFIKEHFGKDADKILKFTDVPIVVKTTEKLLKYNIFEKRKLSLKEIQICLEKGYVPMVLIDYNKITRKTDFYQGHFVVVTGFDKEYLYFHESGPNNPEPNKKVRKEFFEEAINANGTDNDCVIIFGKNRNK